MITNCNAKDYGVAQNRERVFIVSILGEYNYTFPKPIPLTKRLKDYLEDEVDEKYYLSETITTMSGSREPKIAYALNSREFKQRGWLDECPTLCARDYKDPKIVLIPEATKQGYALAQDGDGVYINRPHQKRGVVQKGMIQTIKTSVDDIGVVIDNPLRIRKLTPREALRLMDVSESDIDIITSTVSNTQAYKLAGNSIVVSVLEAIFRNLF